MCSLCCVRHRIRFLISANVRVSKSAAALAGGLYGKEASLASLCRHVHIPGFAQTQGTGHRNLGAARKPQANPCLPQDLALAKLAQDFRIDRVNTEGLYLVTTKDEPHRTIGTVRFRKGTLAYVSKRWGPPNEREGIELAQAFYGVVQDFVKQGITTCTIQTFENQDPQGEIRSATLSCGGKQINVDIVRHEDIGNTASVDECIGAP